MFPYTRQRRTSESSKNRNLLESPTKESGTNAESRRVAIYAHEDADAVSNELTLDDFGGRSDALGG